MKKAARRDAGRMRIGTRDIEGLAWVGQQGALRLDQLAQLFTHLDGRAVSADAARKTIARWTQHGLAETRVIFQGEPPYVWLTASGLRMADLPYPAGEPAIATLHHNRDVTDVRLSLLTGAPHSTWRCERNMRAALASRKRGQTVPHLPDAEVRLADGRLVAIERERTAKTIERTRNIQMGLLTRRHDFDADADTATTLLKPRYDLVCYYAADEAIPIVDAARLQLPAELASRLQVIRWPA
jgi:hypothetical protein